MTNHNVPSDIFSQIRLDNLSTTQLQQMKFAIQKELEKRFNEMSKSKKVNPLGTF